MIPLFSLFSNGKGIQTTKNRMIRMTDNMKNNRYTLGNPSLPLEITGSATLYYNTRTQPEVNY